MHPIRRLHRLHAAIPRVQRKRHAVVQRRILEWKSGTFENLPAEPNRERSITKPANALLLEAAQAMDETTEWTSVADLKNLRWYFRTFSDQSIHMVDLKQAVDAAKGDIATIEMEGTKQPINNVSSATSPVKEASK